MQRKQIPGAVPGIFLENEVVWVCTKSIILAWKKHASYRMPKASIVQDTVKMLAGGKKSRQTRIGNERFRVYPIPVQAFVDARVRTWEDFGLEPPTPIGEE